MQTQTWINELSTKRLAQRSNVFLIETFDFRRLSQWKKIAGASNGQLQELFKTKYDAVYDYNLQRNKLINLRNNQPMEIDPVGGPLKELDNILAGGSNVVMIDYIFIEAHANALVDYLAAWSQDTVMHSKKSTVLVFTADAALFPETLRRLAYTITIVPSTAEERRDFINNLAKNIKKKFADVYGEKLDLEMNEALVQASSGLDMHSIETACLESFYADRKFSTDAFTEYKIKILRTYGLTYVVPQIGFPEVGGYNMLKQYIRNRVITPLRDPEKAEKYGIELPRGILLNGIPGVGKDYFAEALAKELGLPMIKLSSGDLLRGIVGESESRTRQILMLVEELAPNVINMSEFDALAPARSKMVMADSGVTRRVTNKLLEWSGSRQRKAFLIGSTNFLEDIDFAFLRPGRFDEIIMVLPPDEAARQEILRLHSTVLRKLPLESNIDLGEVAKKTFMWTPAELQKLTLDAGRTAMEENAEHVTTEHFLSAMNCLKINIPERENKIKANVNAMKKLDIVNKGFLDRSLQDFRKGTEEDDRLGGFIDNL